MCLKNCWIVANRSDGTLCDIWFGSMLSAHASLSFRCINTVCVNLKGFSPPTPTHTPPCYCQFGCVDLLFWTKSKKNMTKSLSKSRNVILAIKNWSELGDLYAYAQPIFLLCCKFKIITLKTVEVAKTRSLPCHVYKVIFLNKSRICNSSNENLIRVLSHALLILLQYKFQTITLKTVGVAGTGTAQWLVYMKFF